MIPKSPRLWTCHSKVLRGFYQSQVVVLADTKQAAIEKAVEGLAVFIEQSLDEMGYVTLAPYPEDPYADMISIDQSDDLNEVTQARKSAEEAFRAELTAKLTTVDSGYMLQVLS